MFRHKLGSNTQLVTVWSY